MFEQACFSLVREGRQEHEQDSAWCDHCIALDLSQPCWIIIHCGENVWKFHEIPGTGVWVKSRMSDHIHTWVVIFNIFCCCCCRCHHHCWKHPQNLWDGLDAPESLHIISHILIGGLKNGNTNSDEFLDPLSIGDKICNDIFRFKMPPPPLWRISANSSNFDFGGFPYAPLMNHES